MSRVDRVGFDVLTEAGRARLLTEYDEGIARINRGETKFAAGGNERQLAKWRLLLLQEMKRQGEAVPA